MSETSWTHEWPASPNGVPTEPNKQANLSQYGLSPNGYGTILAQAKWLLFWLGTVVNSEILDHARMNKPGQGFYKVLAESALRAIRLCQPLRVPSTGYERWKDLQLNFDAREMLKG